MGALGLGGRLLVALGDGRRGAPPAPALEEEQRCDGRESRGDRGGEDRTHKVAGSTNTAHDQVESPRSIPLAQGRHPPRGRSLSLSLTVKGATHPTGTQMLYTPLTLLHSQGVVEVQGTVPLLQTRPPHSGLRVGASRDACQVELAERRQRATVERRGEYGAAGVGDLGAAEVEPPELRKHSSGRRQRTCRR
eukprot:scaffold121712_cov63-Phaeocystis_antarctica.AAC.3